MSTFKLFLMSVKYYWSSCSYLEVNCKPHKRFPIAVEIPFHCSMQGNFSWHSVRRLRDPSGLAHSYSERMGKYQRWVMQHHAAIHLFMFLNEVRTELEWKARDADVWISNEISTQLRNCSLNSSEVKTFSDSLKLILIEVESSRCVTFTWECSWACKAGHGFEVINQSVESGD